MSALQFRDIRKSYGETEVIHGISLDINEGEFVVFVGPSGCGKSTMLRMVAGLEQITSGELLIGGEVMNEEPPTKRGIAMVFQSYALYPNMTVYQNMAFGLQQAKLPKDEIHDLVMDAAQTLKIEPLLKRRPWQLSGGQSQRVAIGRAIVRNPKIFLFDEPLSNLDAELRVHMRAEMIELHRHMRRTTVYVTHDQVEAMTLADRIVVFNQGVVEQVGSPLDLYNNPANQFVAGFLGSPKMNFIAGRVAVRSSAGFFAEVPGGAFPLPKGISANAGDDVLVGVRPEHIKIVDQASASLRASVNYTEQLGVHTFLYCDLAAQAPAKSQRITLMLPGQYNVQADEVVGLEVDPAQIYCFDSATGAALEASADGAPPR
jgi:multiple sugar transport system ATP-binding protein